MTRIPARRQHTRYLCELAFEVPGPRSVTLEGAILNISMSGAYIRVRGAVNFQTMTLRVTFGQETLTLAARIVRHEGLEVAEKNVSRYGVEFLKDASTQSHLRLIVNRVRASGNGGLPVTITDYWR